MAASLAVGTITFLFTVIWGGPLIRFLRAKGIGEQIRIEGPATHKVKTGTPTMGGVMVIVPVILFTLLFFYLSRYPVWDFSGVGPIGESILLPVATLLAIGLLGGIDDWLKAIRKRQALEAAGPQGEAAPLTTTEEIRGIPGRYKFLWSVLIALVVSLALHFLLGLRSLAIPTVPEKIDIGFFYVPVAMFIIVASAHAVNLTDGLDGLAGGAAAIAFVAYGVIALLQGQVFLVLFCFTMVGALLGFLWYNAYPAQLFMGDTGSLTLGAVLAVVALMTGQWLLLPVVAIVFILETLSVILQVAYFKLTKGRRLFKMAPLHHHFELLGWSEVQVVQRFWLVSLLAAMMGIALALI